MLTFRSFAATVFWLCSTSLSAQTVFDMPFGIPRTHIDVEFHHPSSVKEKSLSLFEGMYVLRVVVPVGQTMEFAIEQSAGNWLIPSSREGTISDHNAGNMVLTGNFLFDTINRYQLRTSLALPLFNDGAEANILADPWHSYRSLNNTTAVIVEGSGAWRLRPDVYVGATAGLEFYTFTGMGTVDDDPSGYITLTAGGGYEGTMGAVALTFKTLYYTGQTFGLSPFTNALNLHAMLRTSGIRPSLTVEIPLERIISDVIPVIFNLRVAVPLGGTQ